MLIIRNADLSQGKFIVHYFDIISAEVVLGTGLLSEVGASFADLLGTRAKGFQNKLQTAKAAALTELKEVAIEINADAVVGVEISYMTLSNYILMVVVNGTPVRLE